MRWRIAVVFDVDAESEEEAYQAGDAIVADTDDCNAEYEGVETLSMLIDLGPREEQ